MRFKTFFRNNWRVILLIFLSTLISIVAISYVPIFTKLIIDNYKHLNNRLLVLYSLGYAGAIIFFLLFEYIKKISINKLSRDYGIRIRSDLFKSMTLMKHSRFNSRANGDHINAIVNDTDTIYENYLFCYIELTISLITTLVYFSYMVYLNLGLSLAIILAAVAAFFIPNLAGKRLNEKRKIYSDAQADIIDSTSDLIEAGELFSPAASDKFTEYFAGHNVDFQNKEYDLFNFQSYTNILSGFSLYFINIVAFIAGIVMVYSGYAELSSMIAMIGYIELISVPIRDMIYQIITIRSSQKVIEKLDFYFDLPAEDKREVCGDFAELELRNLAYSIKDFSLSNINMTFKAGGKYAIIGENGSGKSTVGKLISQELDVDKGCIFIDDKDINKLDCRNLIYYSSRSIVFAASAKDNIAISSPDKNISGQIRSFIGEVFDKSLQSFGKNLSMGQKAKIALGRALHSDKKLIILDEIFANIDKKSELDLTNTLLSDERTIILITHNRDKAYLDLFDKVYEM